MNTVATAVIWTYAALLIVGGFIGWRKSGSRISLTASLISAGLLSIAWRISLDSPRGGFLMASIVSLALAVMFSIRLRKTKRFMPSGMMMAVSIVVTVILAWCTISA